MATNQRGMEQPRVEEDEQQGQQQEGPPPLTGGKRTFSSRNEGRSSYPPARPNNGGKRQRQGPVIDQGLMMAKQMIVAVTGEKVFQLVTVLETESRKFDGENVIVSTTISCAEAFPTKTSTYALLVGAMAGKEATRGLASRVLVQVANRVQFGIGRSERLLLRFLGASIKACGIESKAFFDVLDALVENEDEDKEVGKLKESQIFSTLSAIPWFACSASATRADDAEEAQCATRLRALCDRLSLVKRVSALPARLASLPRAQQDRTDPACDRIAMGLAMAAEGSGNRLLLQDEEFDSLLIGHSPQLPRYGECEFGELTDALGELRIRIVAASKSASSNTSASRQEDDFSPTLLPLFPNGQPNEVLQVQRREKWIERFLARERVLDVLGSYCPKCNEAADALLALNSPYVAVESVFSAMLQMPKPEHSILYYADVLVKLCMKAPTTIPAAIEDALDQILFLEPESMDPDAIDRLSLWLVTHLLAFDLDWPWVKWRLVPTLDPKRSVRALVEQVLQRLDAILPSRADLENPEKEIPHELLALLPIRNANGDSSYFSPNAGPLGEDLVALIKTKPSAAELGSFLGERAPEPQWNTGSRSKLVVQAALHAGKASFTHTRAALERVGPALVGLAANVDDDEEKIVAEAALESAVAFWSSLPAWAVVGIGAIVDVKVSSVTLTMKWLAEQSTSKLPPYWKRRAMEDIIARASTLEERNAAIDAATSGDIDEATDLWLSRRRAQIDA